LIAFSHRVVINVLLSKQGIAFYTEFATVRTLIATKTHWSL